MIFQKSSNQAGIAHLHFGWDVGGSGAGWIYTNTSESAGGLAPGLTRCPRLPHVREATPKQGGGG